MTLSIAARCSKTGQLGVAIASSSIAVGSRCAWAQAGLGAVLTQNVTNPALGAIALQYLAKGLTAPQTLEKLLEQERYPAYRQLLLIDHQGHTAQHTGEKALGIYSHSIGNNCVAGGNLLASSTVPDAMVRAFEETVGESLAVRLLAAMDGAIAAGGEMGPVYSAALKVVDQQPWPIVDLRVDWDDAPISALRDLWEKYQPQLQDYVVRAQNPEAAPSYGVPGDL